MKAGFVLPGGEPAELVDQAVAAEAAGWDAVFAWEGAYHPDAWCILAAMAQATSTIGLGTMLTPLPWRRPWEVAAQAATVDRLSGGRVILTVGLGAAATGRAVVTDPSDRRTRAALLDEGLDVIEKLWSGTTEHAGEHYGLDMMSGPARTLRPVQSPRIPIWVVGAWNRPRSMTRAVRFDGVVPHLMDVGAEGFGRSYEQMVAWVRSHPHPDGTVPEIIWEAETPADDADAATEKVTRWRDRGATWWLESRWGPDRVDIDARIEAGPPCPADDRRARPAG
ncbi:MAG TPA: LLM class flavin-dependent oxidoreductase [Acidimicrobiales bacterium]|nr:LLM class flavin-dependent oxidoreductase [Acidimicrobiales bacterium]